MSPKVRGEDNIVHWVRVINAYQPDRHVCWTGYCGLEAPFYGFVPAVDLDVTCLECIAAFGEENE